MKKILAIIVVIVLIAIPFVLFAGCKKDNNNAESVRNRSYYVTSVKRDNEDITATVTENKIKIIFTTENFKVERGINTEPNYGFYMGTYTIEEDKVILTTTSSGGTFAGINYTSLLKDYYFTTLYYKNSKLHTEFVNGNLIFQYTFEVAEA